MNAFNACKDVFRVDYGELFTDRSTGRFNGLGYGLLTLMAFSSLVAWLYWLPLVIAQDYNGTLANYLGLYCFVQVIFMGSLLSHMRLILERRISTTVLGSLLTISLIPVWSIWAILAWLYVSVVEDSDRITPYLHLNQPWSLPSTAPLTLHSLIELINTHAGGTVDAYPINYKVASDDTGIIVSHISSRPGLFGKRGRKAVTETWDVITVDNVRRINLDRVYLDYLDAMKDKHYEILSFLECGEKPPLYN